MFSRLSVGEGLAQKWLGISTAIFILILFSLEASAFEIDLSRRKKKSAEPSEVPAQVTVQAQKNAVTEFFGGSSVKQDVVILNTEKGFVPSRLSIKKGAAYQVHIVNVNPKEKNVSFILDAFSEHHSTFYGNITSFVIQPAQEGIFSYQCPETSFEGKLIVIANESQVRGLASPAE